MWTLRTGILCLVMLTSLVHSWEPRIYARDAEYEVAGRFCRNKKMFLPGNLDFEEQNSLIRFMERKNIQDVWLSLTRQDYATFEPVKPYNGTPKAIGYTSGRRCLAIRLTESRRDPEIKALPGSMKLPALCETSCDWCPVWKCRRTQTGCSKPVQEKLTWGNAKAECLLSGGHLWVNETYDLGDIGWADLDKYMANENDVWVGWRNVDWTFDKDSEKTKSPVVLNFQNPSDDGDCTIQTFASDKWSVSSCIAKSNVVNGLSEVAPNTLSSQATTSQETEKKTNEGCLHLKTKYFIIFLTAGVICCCISLLSIGCCIRLAMRVRGQNKLQNNHSCHDDKRAGVNDRGLLATIRRSTRGLSQIYSEIFYAPSDTGRYAFGNSRSVPRTATHPTSSISKLTVTEQECEPNPETGHMSDVSVYVKQKQTVGLNHGRLPREFEDVTKETMFVENNPVYTPY